MPVMQASWSVWEAHVAKVLRIEAFCVYYANSRLSPSKQGHIYSAAILTVRIEVVSKGKVALRLLRRSDHCVKRAAEGLQEHHSSTGLTIP